MKTEQAGTVSLFGVSTRVSIFIRNGSVFGFLDSG
jgi:hypothetical protein